MPRMNAPSADTTNARIHRLILIAIMAAAVLLRAEYLLQIEHNTDHAWPIAQALATLDRGEFPLIGQGTSVLFASPPLTGYLYLPFVALTRSPLAVYVFVIALNTLAVLLAYRAARTLVGPRRALIAAALMAVNPWVVEYSRTSWVQSLLPFFACAVAWLLWPVLLGHSRRPVRRTALALIMLTMLGQTYLLGFALLIPVIVLLVTFRANVPRRGLLIGGAVFAAAGALYAAGLLAQWNTVQTRLGDFTSAAPHLSREAWDHAVRLVSGADYALARGTDAPIPDSALRQNLSQIAHVIILTALLLGMALALQAIIRRKPERPPALIALIWFLLPVLMMTYVGQVVHPFYQLIGLPAGYVLAAWGVDAVFRPQGARWRGALLGALAVPFAVLMGLNSARYYQETAAIPGAHGLTALSLAYGLPLGRAVDSALPADGVVFVDVEGWILNSFAGRTFPVIRDTRAPAFTIAPRDGGAYVAAYPPNTEVMPVPAGAARADVIALPDGLTLTVDAFPPETGRITCTLPPDADSPLAMQVDVPTGQGLSLRYYDLHAGGDPGTWTLTTAWQVEARTPTTDQRLYAPFAHVFDADGARVLIVDGEAVPGYEWREGDCHVHRMTFTLPPDAPGPFTVAVGQYDAIHQENVIFTLPDGEYSPLFTLPTSLSH